MQEELGQVSRTSVKFWSVHHIKLSYGSRRHGIKLKRDNFYGTSITLLCPELLQFHGSEQAGQLQFYFLLVSQSHKVTQRFELPQG